MQKTIIVSPLHITVDRYRGSELIWPAILRDILRKKCKGRILKFVVGCDKEEKNVDTISLTNEPVYHFTYIKSLIFLISYNLFNIVYLLNNKSYAILWHFLPYSLGNTFNLGIILKLTPISIVGPIQPPLTFIDKEFSKDSLIDKLINMLFKQFTKIFYPLSILTLQRSNIVIVMSNDQKKDLIRMGIDKDKIHIISPGINEIYKNTHIRTKMKKMRFIVSGWFIERKNLVQVINALNLLDEKTLDNIEVIFYGDGPLLTKVQQACNKNTQKTVEFVGRKPRNEFIKSLASSDIFVTTSLSEGYAQTASEAVGAGLALISTPVGGFKDIIKEAHNGIIISNDASSLATAIKKMVNNPELVNKYKYNSAKYAQENTWDKKIERILNIFDQV